MFGWAPNSSPYSFLIAHYINLNTWEMTKQMNTFELFGHLHTNDNLYKIYVIKTSKLKDKFIMYHHIKH